MLHLILHSFSDRTLVLMAALTLSLIIGGPRWLHRILLLDIPAQIIRRFMGNVSNKLNRSHRDVDTLKSRGKKLTYFAIAIALISGSILGIVSASGARWMMAIEMIAVMLMLPIRQMLEVTSSLKAPIKAKNLEEARSLAEPIARRDTSKLDQHGVLRAGIEHLALGFSQSIISPALWYLILGLPGMMLATIITLLTTLPSNSNPNYIHFSTASTRWHTLLHYIPTKISIIFMALAAIITPSGNPAKLIRTATGPIKFTSTIEGISIAAMAGGLSISLGGPRTHHNTTLHDNWAGDESARVGTHDLTRAQFLTSYSVIILLIFTTALYMIS